MLALFWFRCWCWCCWYVDETSMPVEICSTQSKSDDRRSRSQSPHRELSCQLNSHIGSVSLADFSFMKVIGKGSFGTVSRVCWNLKLNAVGEKLPTSRQFLSEWFLKNTVTVTYRSFTSSVVHYCQQFCQVLIFYRIMQMQSYCSIDLLSICDIVSWNIEWSFFIFSLNWLPIRFRLIDFTWMILKENLPFDYSRYLWLCPVIFACPVCAFFTIFQVVDFLINAYLLVLRTF